MAKLSKILRQELLYNGIYKITNMVNNKCYIGSSSSATFIYKRLVTHRSSLLRNKHHNKYLQSAFNKYGIENFKYEILEICESEHCLKKEDYYRILYKSNNPDYGYDLLEKSGNCTGKVVTPEVRVRISDSLKKYYRLNPSSKITNTRNRGYKHTKESKLKMSKSQKGKIISRTTIEKIQKTKKEKEYKHSEQTKIKLRENHGLKKIVLDLTTGVKYISAADFCRKNNCSKTRALSILKGENIYTNFKIVYCEEKNVCI